MAATVQFTIRLRRLMLYPANGLRFLSQIILFRTAPVLGWPSEMSQAGDVDHSGFVDSTDAELLRDDLLGKNTDIYADNADLALLKKSIL